MSASEKINLSEIANISEDEFKKQLLAWIDDRGVSRALQSKLRAELFEHFNRTQLGRQIAVQHQKSHRIQLSPLVLVLNTLVAEFLYVENCHFTLSVFSAEVPYKNTLPDFEAATTTNKQKPFRLAETELKDIFEAIGMNETSSKTIQKFYTSNDCTGGDRNNAIGKSLLYCIFKILFTGTEVNATKTRTKNGTKEVKNGSIISVDTKSSEKCSHCSNGQKKFKKYQISSRYFKYLNRYLDILSERVRDMSKTLAEINTENPSKRKSNAEASVALESNLKRTLDKVIENVNQLTKSKRKSKKLQDFLHSIDRLSSNLEMCASNMERLIVTVTNECGDLKRSPAVLERKENHIDVDYCTWLQELKTSENGRRFVARLESSLQKTLAKEQESIEKIYEEKMKNYRMLMKLHYKQKYTKTGKCSNVGSPVTKSAELKHSKKIDSFADCYQLLPKDDALEREVYVDRVVQSAKYAMLLLHLYSDYSNLFPQFYSRARLQLLENESKKLDESFQAYLKQQTTRKIQLNEDITNIWHDYTFGKVLLESRDLTTPRKMFHQTSITNTKMPETILTTGAGIVALAQIDSTRTFENPFKQFASEKLFPKRKSNTAAAQTQIKSIAAVKSIDSNDERDEEHIETLLRSVSSESSYGRLPSPKRSCSNNDIKIPAPPNTVATVNQKATPPLHEYPAIVDLQNSEATAIEEAISTIVPRVATENRQLIESPDIDVLTSPTISPLESAVAPEPKKIVVKIEAAGEANNIPLQTKDFMGADHDSVTDDELDESLEISIGPKRDASSSEDVWN